MRVGKLMLIMAALCVIGTTVVSAQTGTPAPRTRSEDFDKVGIIEALTPTSITIDGRVYDITTARLENSGTLAVGVLVDIDYIIGTDGNLIATEIEFERRPDSGTPRPDDLDEFGVITAMSGTTITVNGRVFDIAQADIDDEGTLAVGVVVDIDYVLLADGTALALDVEIEDDRDGLINDCPRPAGWTTYRVRRGDTLSWIAAASRATTSELVEANCLPNARVIIVGQRLFVPTAIQRGSDDRNDDRRDDDRWDDDRWDDDRDDDRWDDDDDDWDDDDDDHDDDWDDDDDD